MKLSAFGRNCHRARTFCPRAVEQLKYLLWIYDVPKRMGLARALRLTLEFHLPAPVGVVTLTVRSNGGSDAFIFSEVLQSRYYDFDLPAEPANILDLGANVGFTTLFFARKYPRAKLAAIEPIHTNVEILRENLGRNAVDAQIIAKAVAVTDGMLKMQQSRNDYGHKVAGLALGQDVEGDELEVDAVSIPSLLEQLGWERVGLLKIDIEGYEAILLRENADWVTRVDAICIEIHQGFTPPELAEIGRRFRFKEPQCLHGVWLLVRG